MQWEVTLAEDFIRKVLGKDLKWSTALADPDSTPEEKQKIFQAGPEGQKDLEETYREWVMESGDIKEKDVEVVLALMEQVLFEVAKRLGTIKLQGLILPRVVLEQAICEVTVGKLAMAYGAVRTRLEGDEAVFFFENQRKADRFRRDVASTIAVR